jgi:hypothetical protein
LDGHELDDKLRAYTRDEEARMEKNLKGVAYLIDDLNTLSLITGDWIMPIRFFTISLHS